MTPTCLRRFRSAHLLVLAVLLGVPDAAQGQSCPNEWSSAFPGDGGPDGNVHALAPCAGELYFGGEFTNCMGMTVNKVARWNGRRWARVGAGVPDPNPLVRALVVYPAVDGVPYAGADAGVYQAPSDPDDPNEPWAPVGITDGPVYALATYDGSLYAAGGFTCIRAPDPNDPAAPCDPNDPN
jgi:hypothetical protein